MRSRAAKCGDGVHPGLQGHPGLQSTLLRSSLPEMSKSTKRDLKTSRFLEGEIDPDKVVISVLIFLTCETKLQF